MQKILTMTTIMYLRLLGLLFFLIIADSLSWIFIRNLLSSLGRQTKMFSKIWWTIATGFILSYIGYLAYAGAPGHDYVVFRTYFAFFGVFLLIYIPKAIIATFYLATNFLSLIFKVLYLPAEKLKRIMAIVSVSIALFMFLNILWGILYNKTRFTVKEIELSHHLLPSAFDGFRLLHYSDAHIGSFSNHEKAKKGLRLIASQNADAILFTGDFINMVPEEAEPYREVLSNTLAKYGKYAVLGNHDLDDYRKWDQASLKEEEILKLVEFHRATGSDVLRNSHRLIIRGTDTIYIAGVDNWGLPPFNAHGSLEDAIEGIPDGAFIILLSHDPSHWKAEIVPLSNVSLTLSGHTHGLQFALNLGKKKWSPISRMYPHWYGLFSEGEQYLYVNPGFGFIGFNGRVGMPPEITLITLRSK